MVMDDKAWGIRIEDLSGGYGGRLILEHFTAAMPGGA